MNMIIHLHPPLRASSGQNVGCGLKLRYLFLIRTMPDVCHRGYALHRYKLFDKTWSVQFCLK